MHPDEEYYTFIVEKLLKELLKDSTVSDQFRWDRLAVLAAARATAEKRISILEEQIVEHRNERGRLSEECNQVKLLISAANQKNNELGGWAHTLHNQRDRLFEENQQLLEKLDAATRDCANWKSKSKIYEKLKWWKIFQRRRYHTERDG